MAHPDSPDPPAGAPSPPPKSIKVIGAGFGRTGTLSLQAALETLYAAPCYHMETIVRPNRVAGPGGDMAIWEAAVAAGGHPDWGALFDARGVAATVDFPGCLYYEELAAVYPDAKVILSVRPAADWFRSFAAVTAAMPRFRPLLRAFPRGRRVLALVTALVYTPVFGAPHVVEGVPLDRDACIATYERHNAAVVARIPPERLLVYHLGDGWAPLCTFLGLPVPDVPYPHVNQAGGLPARVRATLASMAWADGWRWAAGVVAIVAVVAGVLRRQGFW